MQNNQNNEVNYASGKAVLGFNAHALKRELIESFGSSQEGKAIAATWRHKLELLAAFSILYCFLYVYPNLHPIMPPRELPLSLIDQVVPLSPGTFVVYLSEYLLIAVTLILLKDLKVFDTFARQAFMLLILVGPIFILFPTAYPRPAYPDSDNAVVAFAMNLVGNADAPTNCFPSLHVAITSVAVYALRFLKPAVWLGFVSWGLAIFISTLTTKQHYLIDIFGGALAAWVIISTDLWLRKVQMRRNHEKIALTFFKES